MTASRPQYHQALWSPSSPPWEPGTCCPANTDCLLFVPGGPSPLTSLGSGPPSQTYSAHQNPREVDWPGSMRPLIGLALGMGTPWSPSYLPHLLEGLPPSGSVLIRCLDHLLAHSSMLHLLQETPSDQPLHTAHPAVPTSGCTPPPSLPWALKEDAVSSYCVQGSPLGSGVGVAA